MYYLAKIAEAAGLGTIGIGFILSFPHLIGMKVLSAGLLLFVFGWIVESYLLKR